MNLLYKLVLYLIILSGINLYAQNTSNWPYSEYGIGEISPKGFVQSRGMGGVGIAIPCESSLTDLNPACLQGIDSLAFLLEAGWNSRYSHFTDGINSQYNTNINLDYFAIGFRPSSHWACSLGLTPYSAVGYVLNSQLPLGGSQQYTTINLTGSGGINQLYWGNSIKVFPNFSLGLNISYLFGSVSQVQVTNVPLASGNTTSLTINDNLYLSKMILDYGFLYSFKINSNISGNIGGTFANPWELNERHEVTNMDAYGDTLKYSLDSTSVFKLPLKYGIGISLRLFNKALISADYSFSKWSHSNVSSYPSVSYVNSNSFHAGIEYLPSEEYIAPYYKKIKYRMGLRYSNTYLMIGGNQISDEAVSFGLGIPLIKQRMNVGMAVEYGQRGTSGINIIHENYTTALINITLKDFWFIKRRYD